jgi:dCMP deaminase
VSDRPTMDETLLEVAAVIARRGTCTRLRVGAVLAVDSRVCATGFNGAPHGLPHCDHDPSESSLVHPTCTTSVHAEANAVAFAARHGVSIVGASLYCTHTPCVHCAMLLINAGIVRVVCKMWYRDGSGVEILRDAGIDTWSAQRTGGIGRPPIA